MRTVKLIGPSNYHPDYGLVDSFRWKVIHASRRLGVRRAAIEFNLSESTVYRWKRDMESTIRMI